MSSKTSSAHSMPSAGTFTSISKTDEKYHTTPEFIYGGPFIDVHKPSPFLNTATPINLQLQGTFKKSFAYISLKERLPIILTKIIDYISRQGSSIKAANSATDEDLQNYIKFITKLKSDLVTNKNYDLFTVDSVEGKKWNQWISELDNTRYFNNTWLFTECYVYRKLREGCEISKGLKNFDPFEEQKQRSFKDNEELMCILADKVATMLPQSEKDKRKADFITLLKICLWSNKCDLSLSAGKSVTIKGKTEAPPVTVSSVPSTGKQSDIVLENHRELIDPFQLIIDYKDKLLVDDSAKAADQVVIKAENMAKAIEGPPLELEVIKSSKGSPPASPPSGPVVPPEPAEGEELPKIPCPAKLTIPQTVMFDIVCDNAGYELFADLCFAQFLISQKIVQKVRFHLKKYPWFVSDVTFKDFKYVIDTCAASSYRREIPSEPKPEPAEGSAEPPRVITSDAMKDLADQWKRNVEDGIFIPMADAYWTYPHAFKDMKKYDHNMYRKLQYAAAILFKGDLNYRKLLGEKNWNPSQSFEASLQGFIPAPIIAARTVKSDLICGLPRGKWDLLTKADDKWMQTGDYGVIHFCAKAEPLKPSDKPCIDYEDTCFGVICPEHKDI